MAPTPYCSIDDVRLIAELSVSELADAKIEHMMEKSEAEINAMLRETLSGIPYAAGSVPEKIRWLCADLTAAYVLMKMYIGTAPNQSPYADMLRTWAYEQMARIQAGEELIEGESTVSMLSSTPGQMAIFDLGPYKDATMIEYIGAGRSLGIEGISYFNLAWFMYLYA